MQIFTEISSIRTHLRQFRNSGTTIGLVPTMGALHSGHIELVRASVRDCDRTIVSVFVNPIQFNNSEDLENYPRTFSKDKKMLEDAGADMIFYPSEKELYPQEPTIDLNFGEMERVMEGKYRPGHFKGVAIVVSKLFNIIQPDRAYFGQKDFQQLQIIKSLKNNLSFPVEVISVPTVREKNGLAMSSRNQRLSKKGKEQASLLYQSLKEAENMIKKEVPPKKIKNRINVIFKENKAFSLEYFEIVDTRNLRAIETYDTLDAVAICIAAYLEGIRLIDNLYLRLKS